MTGRPDLGEGPSLVAFANRLPVVRDTRGWQAASGGLVAALRPALEAREASWVGWDGGAADVPKRLPGSRTQLVPGALVLSEFAGAVEELPEALPCNPYDIEGVAGFVALALELDEDDRRERLRRMAARVATNDVHRWSGRELAALEPRAAEVSAPSAAARRRPAFHPV